MKKDEFYILGLNSTGPNTSACLIHNERGILAFAEEERFSRVKLATDKIPTDSIKYCLEKEGLSLESITAMTVGWDHKKYPEFMAEFYKKNMSHPEKDEYSKNLEAFRLADKSTYSINKKLQIAFSRAGIEGPMPKLVFEHHHQSHVASVFYPSPFETALVVVIDGSGEELATSIWLCEGEMFSLLRAFELPDSLGYFYGAMTEFLGFSIFTGEGKVMGMAPYGQPNLEFRKRLESFLKVSDDGSYTVDPRYIYFGPRMSSFRYTDYLSELLCLPPRTPESDINQVHYDLAYETQLLLENVVSRLIRQYVLSTSVPRVCIAGGVANNCKMNGVISSLPEVESCFVVPASADSGVAYGSALLYLGKIQNTANGLRKSYNACLGPSFSDDQVIACLRDAKISSYKVMSDDELFYHTADLLAEGKIVAWFQGRMENGARALGNRSILVHPGFQDMKIKINREVKRREAFRPFAPSVLTENASDWFCFDAQGYPEETHKWMIQAAPAREHSKKIIPAVTHI
ncbi:MAG: carbamoyltransferase N-terminal domain-containing protein, partial [Dehalococcoidia bacterium]|nr:carbamoyltransferase N-terminal domain-containing protein [Dehalococcoidia bacterium]